MNSRSEEPHKLRLPELPPKWVWSIVEAIGAQGDQTVLTGPFGTNMGTQDFVEDGEGNVPVLTIGCLRLSGIDRRRAVFLPSEKAEALGRYRLRHGDVLFSRMATVGRAGFVERSHEGSLFNYHIMRLRLEPEVIDPYFFIYYVRSSQTVTDFVRSVNHGMTRDGINTQQLLTMPVPVAPRNHQAKIVESLDFYTSRLQQTTTLLERVQRNLKRYRASVLKAAVEGRLVPTEAEVARAEKRDYEPASVLLKRILAERRQRWEKEGRRGKYEEPALLDAKGLPALPAGWCWSSLRAVADLRGGLTKGQKRRPNDVVRLVPYLRVANVQRGHLEMSMVKEIEATEEEISELRLAPGDVLFNEGGDRDKLGRGWVWENQLPVCIHQNHVFRARLPKHLLLPKFVSWYGNSFGQQYFLDQGKQTTNLASINITKLGALPVPIPPFGEQIRIVAEIERLFSVANAIENAVQAQLLRTARLRQSILKWAFDGKLVDQDPTDEPASVLLAHIKAQKAPSTKPDAAPRNRPPRKS